jgi:hypothetical protein
MPHFPNTIEIVLGKWGIVRYSIRKMGHSS